MRRMFAVGLAVWLASASLLMFAFQPVHAQTGPILGDAPRLESGAVIAASGTDIVSAAAVPSVDPSSRSASADFFYSYYTAEPPINWTGSQASCNPGTTSASFKAAVIDRIAYYRAMAGISSSIGLSATASSANQQAALMFSRNTQLSHTPGSNWACYTSSGAQSAGNSNIALGAWGVYAIDSYMRDPGPQNGAVGHRRWLLFPQTQSFGTGDIPNGGGYVSANALAIWDSNVGGPRPATRDAFVAWPPAGYVPYQVTFARWSFSWPNANFGSASVTVTLDGVPISAAIDSTSDYGMGENTIVFRPHNYDNGSIWPNPGTDKTYTVKIAGVNVGGQNRTFTYQVTVFDPASAPPVTTPSATPTRTLTPTITTTAAATNTPTVIPGGYAPGDLFQTTTNLNMRSAPGTSSSSVGVLLKGTIGEVTGAPVFANGYTWYPVIVDGYGSGWAAGEYFLRVTPTPTPTPSRTPTSPPTATNTPTQGPQPPTATVTPTATATETAPAAPSATRIPGGYLPGDIVRTTATVNFRSGPGTNYGVVSVVSSNSQATITGSPVTGGGYTWYPMDINGVGSGWIASNYLTLVMYGSTEPTKTPTPLGGIGIGETVYTTAGLNIRTGPGAGYSSIGVAPKGTSAVVTGTAVKSGSAYWFPLDVTGIGSGWASGAYLSSSPTVQGPILPTTSDPVDEQPVVDASIPTQTPLPTATATPTVVDTVVATTEPTESNDDLQISSPPLLASPFVPDDETAPTEPPSAPVEEPEASATPEWLPIERVQRSANAQPGQTLVDNDPGTIWFADGAGQPLAMVVLDLGQNTTFSQIRWLPGDQGLSGTLYLAVSSDGENWTDLDPTLATATDDGWQSLDSPVTGQYIRFIFVNDTGADWLGGLAEVRIMP